MNKSQRFFYIMTLCAVLFAIYFLRSFLSLVAIAFLTVMIFNPLYHKLLKVFKGRQGAATSITVFVAMLCLIIPTVLVSIMAYNQVVSIVSDASNVINKDNSSFSEVVSDGVDVANKNLEKLSIDYKLTEDKVYEVSGKLVSPASGFLIGFIKSLGGTLSGFFTNFIIYLILLSSIFPHQRQIGEFLKKLSPLDDDVDDIYITRVKAMAMSMVKGTLVIAFIQGLLGALFLKIVGIPYVFFFTVLLTFLSFIPLGGGVISIPVGIGLLVTGNIWQGLFILLTHFFVITNVDNVLRPKLVSKDARLPGALTLLAVFAGLQMFGALGVVYGPVVMIFIYTTLEIYNKYYSHKFVEFKNQKVEL